MNIPANDELRSCCNWLKEHVSPDVANALYKARRPPLITEKERVLDLLNDMEKKGVYTVSFDDLVLIRKVVTTAPNV